MNYRYAEDSLNIFPWSSGRFIYKYLSVKKKYSIHIILQGTSYCVSAGGEQPV